MKRKKSKKCGSETRVATVAVTSRRRTGRLATTRRYSALRATTLLGAMLRISWASKCVRGVMQPSCRKRGVVSSRRAKCVARGDGICAMRLSGARAGFAPLYWGCMAHAWGVV